MGMRTKLLITGLALMAATTLVNAQNPGNGRGSQNRSSKGMAYADADKDGICDNFKNTAAGQNAGNGYCNGTGNGRGQRQGIGQQGQRQGQGMGQQGQGRNRTFVDADKDGICDRFQKPVKQ